MTVHIGRLTSEVSTTGGDSDTGGADGEPTPWESRRRTAEAVDRIRCERMRTATGFGDD